MSESIRTVLRSSLLEARPEFKHWTEKELEKLPVGTKLRCSTRYMVGGKDTIVKLADGSWKDDTDSQPQYYMAKRIAVMAQDYKFGVVK